MNDLFYLELREKIREIRRYEQTGEPDEIAGQRKQTVAVAAALPQLGWNVKKEGLLAAEELSYTLAERLPLGEFLKELIDLVVDGTDITTVEEIGLQRYFVEDRKEYQGLMYLLLLRGVLGIARGEHPGILEKQLRTMLPAELDELYWQREQEIEEQERKKEKIQGALKVSRVIKVCPGTYTGEMTDGQAVPVKLLDSVFCNISDKDFQRLLREADNNTLEAAMTGLGPRARAHVFQNMSGRLAGMVAGDIISGGLPEAWEVTRACLEVLGIWNRLADEGEVTEVREGQTARIYALKDGKNPGIYMEWSDFYREIGKLEGFEGRSFSYQTKLIRELSDVPGSLNRAVKEALKYLGGGSARCYGEFPHPDLKKKISEEEQLTFDCKQVFCEV